MKNFLIYAIEASLIINIFHLFYKAVYYKLTYFVWNRYFLQTSIVVAFILPLLNLSFFDIDLPTLIEKKSILQITAEGLVYKIAPDGRFADTVDYVINMFRFINWKIIFTLIYLYGAIRFTIALAENLFSLKKLRQKSKLIENNNLYKLFLSEQNTACFSFFNYIFINKSYTNLPEIEQQQILEHEKLHCQQKHSFDILMIEIVSIFLWFNPWITKLKNDIKENHEFIVDNILTRTMSSYNYSNLIMKTAGKKVFSIVNAFANSQIYSRIKLLSLPVKEKIRKFRFVAAQPVLIMLVICILLITNTLNNFGIKPDIIPNEFVFAADDYKIVTNYIDELIVEDPDNLDIKYKISHKKISFQTPSYAPIFAVADGTIKNIQIKGNWGLNEVEITILHQKHGNLISIYQGLEKENVKLEQHVKRSQIIGYAGDNRLYEVMNLQILKDDKPVDPYIYIDK